MYSENRQMKNKNFNARLLTKSRFKVGLECPRKLYYAGSSGYANQQLEDPFLESLAEGGFQVGELAKEYFPGGIDVHPLDYETSLAETNKLLESDEVVIFEAAIKYDDLFIRVDVLEKRGNTILFHEVKAKSINSLEKTGFLSRQGKPTAKWKPYLYDVAFQKYVIKNAFPKSKVLSHLMLIDKSVRSTTSGLNQKFHIKEEEGRKSACVVSPLTESELNEKILKSVNVDVICDDIFRAESHRNNESETFSDLVSRLARCSLGLDEAKPSISTACGSCEFHCSDHDDDLKDGRNECLSMVYGFSTEQLKSTPLIFELWNHHSKQKFIDDGVIRLSDLNEDDIGADPYCDGNGLQAKQRQWLQIEKCKLNDDSVWVDKIGLKAEISSWSYPLNFIDFETTRVALPFHENQVPYEAIAFQFSHHMLHDDERVEHVAQFLHAEPGVFPNFDFIRALKSSLESNSGSVFCYSRHENSILNAIKQQLEDQEDLVDDASELITFIQSITVPTKDSKLKWDTPREMVDLLELVKQYIYLPETRGSNSIKYVLPAILSASELLKKKYAKSIGLVSGGLTSLNFPQDWVWLREDEDSGRVIDPYKMLPPVFDGYGIELDERIASFESLNNGGAALTAYAKLQFEELPLQEVEMIKSALFKYCELDTLAMVMLVEYFKELIGGNR